MSAGVEFHYHQGVAPMMWVIFALSIIELVVVHLFVALKWPYLGWPLTIISVIGAVWILFWIRSFRKRPHLLVGDRLTLNFGSIKTVQIDLADIGGINRTLEPGALEQKGIMNLAGIAYPNRSIELTKPLEKSRSRIFIRLDQPDDFDRALEARGVRMA